MIKAKLREKYRDLSRQQLLDKAHELGWHFDLNSGSCSQCTVAALHEMLGFDNILVKVATSSCGGQAIQIMGTCGALVGGTMVLDYYFGRPVEDLSYQKPVSKDLLFEAAGVAKLLYDKFVEKYGAVTCAGLQQKLYGRVYWLTDPDEAEKYDKAGGHSDPERSCLRIIGDATRWVIEILLDKGVIKLEHR